MSIKNTRAAALALGLAALAQAAPLAAQVFPLDAGDKLRIHVEDWPAMSGEYPITADKKLVLPIVGDVAVKTMATQEIAAEIASTLMQRKKLSSRPTAIVAVSAYRPFFILGDVQRSGDYAIRPYLTVQQAVSMAGGVYRPADYSTSRFERDAIVARGDLKVLLDTANRLKIREARLKAERDEKPIEPLATILRGEDDADAARFYAEDQADLASRNSEFAAQVALVKGLKTLYAKEIDSLRLQIAAENRSLTAIRGEGASVEKLTEKGLTSNQRRLTVERAIAQTISQLQALETTIVRTEQSQLMADEKLAGLGSKRREGLDVELQKLQADAVTVRAKIDTSRQLVAEAEQFSAVGSSGLTERKGLNIKAYITRRRDGSAAETLPALPTDSVEPGDVIMVERVAQSGAQR